MRPRAPAAFACVPLGRCVSDGNASSPLKTEMRYLLWSSCLMNLTQAVLQVRFDLVRGGCGILQRIQFWCSIASL